MAYIGLQLIKKLYTKNYLWINWFNRKYCLFYIFINFEYITHICQAKIILMK